MDELFRFIYVSGELNKTKKKMNKFPATVGLLLKRAHILIGLFLTQNVG
jgi:hypothetical protein